MRRIYSTRSQKFVFKNSVGTVLTTAYGWSNPLVSTYVGLEVDPANIKNTRIFIVPFDLRTKIDQKDYVHVGNQSWLITGYKRFRDHSELVGLLQGATEAFGASTAAGIISEWAFQNSSGLLTDAQGRNNLTNVNGVTWNSGKPSQIRFNIGSARFTAASSQYLKITDAAQSMLDLNINWTILFWFKHVALPTGSQAFIAKVLNTGSEYSYFIDTNSSHKITMSPSSDGIYSSGNNCSGSTAFGINVWVSIAVVANGTDIRLYTNGVLDSNGSSNPKAWTASLFNNSLDFCLGAFATPANYFNGYLAHVMIFNQAKTAAQILEWHNSGIIT